MIILISICYVRGSMANATKQIRLISLQYTSKEGSEGSHDFNVKSFSLFALSSLTFLKIINRK